MVNKGKKKLSDPAINPSNHAPKTVVQAIEEDVSFRYHSLRGVDMLWLLLCRATAFNPVCSSVYILQDELKIDDFRSALKRQSDVFPKYKQRLRVAQDRFFHAPSFENDPAFSVDRHVSAIDLPEPCGTKELNVFVSKFISKDWDENLPLWEVVYIRKYTGDGKAKAAMVSRGHHTQADGQGFIMSALFITSYGKELNKVMLEGSAKLRHARLGQLPPSEVSPMLRHLQNPWETPYLRPLVKGFLFLVYWAAATVDALQRVIWSLVHVFYMLWFYLSTFWRVEMIVPVRPGKREAVFALSKPQKLSDVKTIQHAFSCSEPGGSQRGWKGHVTVNDVLCAIIADVVSAAIETRRKTSSSGPFTRWSNKILPMPIGFFIPISLRAPGQWDMRNLSTGCIAYMSHLPEAKPSIERMHKHIHKCKQSLKVLKRSYLPVWAFHFLQILGQFPVIFYPIWGSGVWQSKLLLKLKDKFWGGIISSMPAIVTNIPGPPAEAKMEGSNILRWTGKSSGSLLIRSEADATTRAALPPQGGRGSLGIGIITYNGSVYVTASVDKVPGHEDAAEKLCEDFERRFKLYLRAAEHCLDD